MNNLFSYDNPIMQILMKIGDLMILNFIYLVCCVPVFTIGAASAGLYTAMKVMQDPEDDTSLVEAFFRGFKAGFGTVTLAWGGMMLLMLVVGWLMLGAYAYGLAAWICLTPMAIFAIFIAMIPAIHSRFGCTAWQLVRNVWFFIIAHPLRVIGVAVLTWLPMILLVSGLFTQDIFGFMSLAPIWCTLYFGTAWAFSYSFLKKPFFVLIENFNKQQNSDSEETALPEIEEAVEEV